MKFFISFSTKDKNILQSFVDHYLKLGLQINSDDIYCTGIENSKPKTGDDFRTWIKNKIVKSDIVFLLISRNYKNSEVCLNEMGAVWSLNKKVIPILLPPIDYSDVGFLHNSNQLLKINSKEDLFTLKDDLNEWINTDKIKSSNLNSQIDKLINEINKIPIFPEIPESNTKSTTQIDLNYFEKYLVKDIDYRGILLQAQPTLSDCKAIFNHDFYKDVYTYYSFQYKYLLEVESYVGDLSEYDSYQVERASYNDLRNKKHELPGGMNELVEHFAIKSNTKFFSVRFKREQEEFGTSLSAWAYVNNRWVLFTKPWWIVEFISKAKYDKDINRWIRFLKRFKVLRNYNSFELQYIMNRINKNNSG
jgi:hypothetical protein